MSNIFNPEPGAVYDEKGQKVDGAKMTDTDPVPGVVPPVEPTTTPAPTPSTTTPSPEPTPATPATPEINWEERTGGKFKSWEEIEAKITAQPTKEEIAFANEQSRLIAEYLKEGKIDDVYQVLSDQRKLATVDKMSDADALRLQMEFKNTHFSPEDIQEEFASKYLAEKPEPIGTEDDYEDEDAYKAAQKAYDKEFKNYEREQKKLDRLLKTDAANAKEELKSLRSDIVLPDISPAASTPTAEQDVDPNMPTQEQLQAARNSYLTSLGQSVTDFKSIPFKLSDEGVAVEANHVIDATEIAALQKDLTEKNVLDEVIGGRYLKGDGYDTKQLLEDIYFLNNKEKIIANFVKQAIAQDRKKDLAERKNINLGNQSQGTFEPSQAQQLEQFSKSWFGQG